MTSDRRPLRCWAEIDLDALERNVQRIRAPLLTSVTKRVPRLYKTNLGV